VDRSEVVMMTLERLDLYVELVELAHAESIGELASVIHAKSQA
jgi:hypothetical protein